MQTITIATGNAHKLKELTRLLPKNIAFTSQKIDLDELQSTDPREIIEHKVRQAYEIIGAPVLVEDVSAGLDELHGLPGPFIKFFVETLGKDALHQLVKTDAGALVTCTIGYYDGERLIIAQGDIHGTVVAERKTENAFGIDGTFVPDGETLSFAEMTAEQKDRVSHRGNAIRALIKQLEQ